MSRASAETIQENRDYTLVPWAIQSAAHPMHLVRSQDVWFWDGAGKKRLDRCSRLVNPNIGHRHPEVIEGIKPQADELCFAGPGFASEPRGALGRSLAEADRALPEGGRR
jgi:taurine--2-oxoglutarate transaminase